MYNDYINDEGTKNETDQTINPITRGLRPKVQTDPLLRFEDRM
jgi:hypothetical protein